MFSLPIPVECYRRAYGSALISVVWGGASLYVLPGAPLAQGAIILVAGVAALHAFKKQKMAEERLKNLEKVQFFNLSHIPKKPGAFYLGLGYRWTKKHTQNLYEQSFEEVPKLENNARGDLAIFGQSAEEAGPFFYPEKDNNQHLGVFGSTGFGKSYLAQLIIAQAVAMQDTAVIVVDPKPDKELFDRTKKAALAAGRVFRVLDFVHPELSATYNPCSRYRDPAQLNARGQALCPPAKGDNKYFVERAGSTFQLVGMAMDAARQYLLQLGGVKGEAPQVLRCLWARQLLLAEQPDIEPTEDAIANKAKEVKLPIQFSPNGWVPRLTAGDTWGVDRPQILLGWLVRIAHFGVVSAAQPLDAAEGYNRDKVENLWNFHTKEFKAHPLITQANSGGWPWFEANVPNIEAAKVALDVLNTAIKSIYFDICMQGQDYWQKVNSSLTATLPRFRGPRQRIVDAAEPEIDWHRVFEEREVIYFALGAQVDRAGAEAFARVIVEDFVSYVGERSVERMPVIPTYFICDEIHTFLTPGFIDLLNKSRSVGVRCVPIGQTIHDLEDKVGKTAAAVMLGNLNMRIQLRAPGDDAEAFAKSLGNYPVLKFNRTVTSTTGAGNTGNVLIAGFSASEGTQYSYEDKPKIPASAIRDLPIGQAFVSGMGWQAIVQIPTLGDLK